MKARAFRVVVVSTVGSYSDGWGSVPDTSADFAFTQTNQSIDVALQLCPSAGACIKKLATKLLSCCI